MARAYARSVVNGSETFDKIPTKIVATAWRKSMEALSRLQIDAIDERSSRDVIFMGALARFNSILEFCRGDRTQDIYKDLIHNENNMRPVEINGLFKMCELRNVCLAICDKLPLLEAFAETEPGKAHGQLLISLNAFFERRNQIAHTIAMMRSSGPDLIMKDIDLFSRFGMALCETLEAKVPEPKDRTGNGQTTVEPYAETSERQT